ncbi:hypothetical protein ASD11_03170 [Aeromicrobium sp. Root495]|uniref:NAD-dependent epimerase/dehydratase family protein n=1 Tax=Aeromicrobium sp. Root495 TaxID=1736550 RepID=UPI00070188F5|nr:NAD-dependent epimerase/dehydratase family protein [Aeromicrobium sp. Root495]KQY58669.1 hypothetical protein ASD11_03170 [Aeromicrobium sp. Root495]RYJ06992.1 MAG: NAD-dependent epimerase/dehydratase family protein [Actinomycetales bacterium]
MKILLTGGTGFIGSAVLARLTQDGHDVVAVVRSEDSAQKVQAAGATAALGDLTDQEWLAAQLRQVDGAIHTAAAGDGKDPERDDVVLAAVQDAFAGTDKSYVHTGGIWTYGSSSDISESDPDAAPALTAWRVERESRLLASGLTASVVQPAVVYGHGQGIPAMVAAGPLIGDGTQHWTTVHVDDLADLYLAVLTKADGGRRYVGANGHNPTHREIVQAAGGDVTPTSVDDVHERFGEAFGDALLLDQQASGSAAREAFDWSPDRPTLLEELAQA